MIKKVSGNLHYPYCALDYTNSVALYCISDLAHMSTYISVKANIRAWKSSGSVWEGSLERSHLFIGYWQPLPFPVLLELSLALPVDNQTHTPSCCHSPFLNNSYFGCKFTQSDEAPQLEISSRRLVISQAAKLLLLFFRLKKHSEIQHGVASWSDERAG